jgi:hypothetical protein
MVPGFVLIYQKSKTPKGESALPTLKDGIV